MGWARANILYDKLGKSPEPGSLQEALCILIYNAREDLKMFETIIGAMSSSDKGFEDVVKEYEKARFPFIERSKAKESKRVEDVLEKAFLAGPMVIDRSDLIPEHSVIKETK